VWADDSLIDEITIRRGRQVSGGHVVILITELPGSVDDT
jgi:Holliday junction resolvase RusA-like endonuclease